MAWSNSKVFTIYISDMIGNVAALDYDADTIKVPTFNNSVTPDQTVAAASSAYNTGVWTTGNEVTSSTDLPAGGLTLGSKTVTRSSGNVVVSAANAVSGSAATGTVYGNLVYDDTLTTPVADQGQCYNYYGGAVTVTAGTLTIAWDGTNGIMKFAA